MKNPYPINLTPPEQVRKQGWAAEARDADGHLISARAWLREATGNQNEIGLAEFITDYATDCTITIFPENIRY